MAIVCGWSGEALAQATPTDAPIAPTPPATTAPSDPAAATSTGATSTAATSTAATSTGATADPPPLAPRRPLGKKLEPDKFSWRYPEFRTSEYVVTGIFGGLTIAGLMIPTGGGRWRGENPLDDSVRDALRVSDREGRKMADDVSDITLVTSLNYLAFDAGVVAWWARGKGSVAYQVAAIDVETIAITAGVTSVVKGIAARERPYAAECSDALVARTDDCEDDSLNRSFFSGHTSTTFAAAGLTCMHHGYLALYDDPVGDAAACVAAFGMAGTTGVLRVMSDNHHTTDVITGAVIGTTLGLGVPWLLHYKDEVATEPHGPGAPEHISVTFVPGPTSATLMGTF